MDRGNAIVRERALRDAVLAGDAAAWRAWYDEHFARLAAYVNWRCGGSTHFADDVLQETWLVAVRRLKAFDPARGTFAAWLAGIAANAVRNALRSRKRQRRRSRPLAEAEPAAKEQAAPDHARRVAATLAAINPLYEDVLRQIPRPARRRDNRRGEGRNREGHRIAVEPRPASLPRTVRDHL